MKKTSRHITQSKNKILEIFNKNVKGKKAKNLGKNKLSSIHDGWEGHWLETKMGVIRNGNVAPDLLGFEMKNATSSKTTFGDWSADHYIFSTGKNKTDLSRGAFFKIFGKKNSKKKRYSWSGEASPKVGKFNRFGQRLEVDKDSNIEAIYCFQKDLRENKAKLVPRIYQKRRLVLAKWHGKMLKKKLEKKFYQLGWFTCRKDLQHKYISIHFGRRINFAFWILKVKSGLIYFDSGMNSNSKKPRSPWRASNKLWDSLLIKDKV